MDRRSYTTYRVLGAGILALVIAMGVSRFAYTPLLPVMQTGIGLSDDYAGYLASMNYAGYLLGAMRMTWWPLKRSATGLLRAHLLINIATTGAMALTTAFPLWMLLRFAAGYSSAMIFVLASGIVLQYLAAHRLQGWSGWLYSAIGIGIILTAITVPPLGAYLGWRGGWLGMGVLCFLLAYPAYYWLAPLHKDSEPSQSSQSEAKDSRKLLPWLATAYFLEGLGYIVTGTFLVVLLQRTPGLEHSSTFAWLVVGLAAAPSCILWMRFGMRTTPVKALIAAHLTQAVGIVLPILWPTTAGAVIGAILYGGTFMGIVTLSMFLGRAMSPDAPHRYIGLLTAAFGAGQIIGPTIAGVISARTSSFDPALYGASAVVIIGALLLWIGSTKIRISTVPKGD